MTEEKGEETVTAGEFHELADSNLVNALLAQAVDPVDPAAGQRELSLSQYALLSIATSLREIAKLQAELNERIAALERDNAQAGERTMRAEVLRRRRR